MACYANPDKTQKRYEVLYTNFVYNFVYNLCTICIQLLIQISIFDCCGILGITRASKSTADELTLKSGKDDQLKSVRHLS